ncbi:MAG: pentapeptide repeat-containing protein, partial [Rhodanobacteraceae bacterium]
MQQERKELSGRQAGWFESGEALSAHTGGGHPLEVSNVIIAHRTLEDARLQGVTFRNVTWDAIHGDRTSWDHSVVEDSDITRSDFRDAVFRNVTFKRVHFHHVNMVDATLENVHFVECNFDDVVMTYLHGGEVVFDHAQFPKLEINGEENNFSGSSNQLVFRDTDLTWPVFTHLEPGASLTFINSTVENGNIGHGHIDEIESKDSHLELAGPRTSVGQLDITGGYTAVRFSESKVGTISVKDTALELLNALQGSTVGSFHVSGCRKPENPASYYGISLGDVIVAPSDPHDSSHFGKVTISDCTDVPLHLQFVVSQKLTVRNVSAPLFMLRKSA